MLLSIEERVKTILLARPDSDPTFCKMSSL